MRIIYYCLFWISFAACGITKLPGDAGSTGSPPSPGRELAPAAGRLVGGAWTADIQLGSMTSQASTSGEGWAVHGSAPLNP